MRYYLTLDYNRRIWQEDNVQLPALVASSACQWGGACPPVRTSSTTTRPTLSVSFIPYKYFHLWKRGTGTILVIVKNLAASSVTIFHFCFCKLSNQINCVDPKTNVCSIKMHQRTKLQISKNCLKGKFYLIPKTWIFQVIRLFARSFSDVQLFMSTPSAPQYLTK